MSESRSVCTRTVSLPTRVTLDAALVLAGADGVAGDLLVVAGGGDVGDAELGAAAELQAQVEALGHEAEHGDDDHDQRDEVEAAALRDEVIDRLPV